MKKQEVYDLIIIGAGPAAISAAIYAARYKINFLIIGGVPGGNMSVSYDIDNYPGFVHTTGPELTKNMISQLRAIGHELVSDNIKRITREKEVFNLTSQMGDYQAKRVLLAIGTERNKLNVPGENELIGRGVSYCATCDGFFFKNKIVAVIGGGDSAVEAAVFLGELAKKVYIVIRRDEFRADPDWQDRLEKSKNIEVVKLAKVKEIVGKDKVEKIILDRDNTEIKVDGVFIEIGETPSSVLFEQLKLKRDKDGYVLIDNEMKTSLKGIWAAGDSTTGSNKFRQIVTACAEGAIAANTIYTDIRDSK
ncbi:MAG: FAD-dependent oxidoreductase [Patescibacteria group bacterium]|nr:FAD-dependent oxidoreductase [Patescibacteria group bacterium]